MCTTIFLPCSYYDDYVRQCSFGSRALELYGCGVRKQNQCLELQWQPSAVAIRGPLWPLVYIFFKKFQFEKFINEALPTFVLAAPKQPRSGDPYPVRCALRAAAGRRVPLAAWLSRHALEEEDAAVVKATENT